jgi:hypothetical protein
MFGFRILGSNIFHPSVALDKLNKQLMGSGIFEPSEMLVFGKI